MTRDDVEKTGRVMLSRTGFVDPGVVEEAIRVARAYFDASPVKPIITYGSGAGLEDLSMREKSNDLPTSTPSKEPTE